MSTAPLRLMRGAVRVITAPAESLMTACAVWLMTAASTDFVAGVYEKLASTYDWVFGPTLHAGRLQAMQRMAISPKDRILEMFRPQ